MERLKIALAGVGGFGRVHVEAAEKLVLEGLIEIVAFAEPSDGPPAIERLEEFGAYRYTDYETMLASEPALQLVCVASPTGQHHAMAKAALERGLHVFLEKPPAVRIQDFRELAALQEKNDLFCAVDFHDIARPEIFALKNMLCEGALGPLREIHAHARWVRGDAYYARTPWAGKLQKDGAWVLDGPLNNACGHVLNLTAYFAGTEPHEFAKPVWVQGELYRAAVIEGEDTSCLRASFSTGVEVCIHVTQAASRNHPRSWTLVGENGTATYDDEAGATCSGLHLPLAGNEPPNFTLLRRLCEVAVGSDEPLLMPLAESEAFVLLSNGAYESSANIHPVPPEHTRRLTLEGGDEATTIEGIDELMLEGAESGKLLSEMNVPWAVPGARFNVDNYSTFPERWREK